MNEQNKFRLVDVMAAKSAVVILDLVKFNGEPLDEAHIQGRIRR